MKANSTLLVIAYVWPEPNSSAAGKRMIQLFHAFQQICDRIIVASTAKKSGFEIDLSLLQIEEQEIKLNHDSFDDFIKVLQPHYVLYDRFYMEEQYGWRVRKYCDSAVQILDTEDLHFLRLAREMAYKAKRDLKLSDLQSDYAKREIASILRCDCSLIISTFELEFLQKEYSVDSSILYYYPLFEDVSKEPISGFNERENFVFVGNFWHEPNWQTLLYIKNEIWPGIRSKLHKVELNVYGAYPSEKVFQLNNIRQGFIIKGRVQSSKEVLAQSRVLLAPIVYGAGLKGKLLEAMVTGTPSVTSYYGAEGIEDSQNWPGFIACSSEDVIQNSIELYTNAKLWASKQKLGYNLLKSRFSHEEFLPHLIRHLEQLKENLNTYREQNFLGAILRHHTLASNEYMSKWIAEKSKKSDEYL